MISTNIHHRLTGNAELARMDLPAAIPFRIPGKCQSSSARRAGKLTQQILNSLGGPSRSWNRSFISHVIHEVVQLTQSTTGQRSR